MMYMYLIFDRKAENVNSFFTADNNVSAIRGTVQAAHGQGLLGEYPAEFELRLIGHIDKGNAQVTIYETPELLGSVENLIAASKPKPKETKK